MGEPATSGLRYEPDYGVPPGETLLEILEELGMSQAELAERTGRPRKTINEIIKGKAAITPETALQFERAFRIPASFWNNLQRNYDAIRARLAERENLEEEIGWLDKIPVAAMVRAGWIRAFDDRIDQLEEVLAFFGVASAERWEELWANAAVQFRKAAAFESHPGSVAAWLRMGELIAREMDCEPFDRQSFLSALEEARSLTREPPSIFQSRLRNVCAKAGVAVVFVPQIEGARVSGATRWVSSEKALVQLSLRYKSDDQLWFSFFHECAHILRHGKKAIFLETKFESSNGRGAEEEEADRFAQDFLIPPIELDRFVAEAGPRPTKRAIVEFAERIGIAPGIVVGRLQHDGVLPYSHCNGLKRRLDWATA